MTIHEQNDTIDMVIAPINSSRTSNASFTVSILRVMILTNWPYLVFAASRVVFIIGLFSNTFILLSVATRRLFKKSPIFIFLSFIALADTLSLFTVNGADELELLGINMSSSLLCRIKYFINYATSKASVYILIAAYCFRLHALRYPLQFRTRSSQNKLVVIMCLTISFLTVLSDIYAPFMHVISNSLIGVVPLSTVSYIVKDCGYTIDNTTMKSSYPLIYIFTYVVIPGFILTGLSIAVLVVLHRSYKTHRQLCTSNPTRGENNANDENKVYTSTRNTASILVPMSVLHIVLTLPRYVVVIRYYFGDIADDDLLQSLFLYFLTSRCISPLNYGLNLYLQLLCSKFFRQTMLPRFKTLNKYCSSCSKAPYQCSDSDRSLASEDVNNRLKNVELRTLDNPQY